MYRRIQYVYIYVLFQFFCDTELNKFMHKEFQTLD